MHVGCLYCITVTLVLTSSSLSSSIVYKQPLFAGMVTWFDEDASLRKIRGKMWRSPDPRKHEVEALD